MAYHRNNNKKKKNILLYQVYNIIHCAAVPNQLNISKLELQKCSRFCFLLEIIASFIFY